MPPDRIARGLLPEIPSELLTVAEVANVRFHPGRALLHDIARAYELYLSGNETLRGSRHFLDFRSIIEAKFELPLDEVLGGVASSRPRSAQACARASCSGLQLEHAQNGHVPHVPGLRRSIEATLDADEALVEVDVLPLQGGKLALAHSGMAPELAPESRTPTQLSR